MSMPSTEESPSFYVSTPRVMHVHLISRSSAAFASLPIGTIDMAILPDLLPVSLMGSAGWRRPPRKQLDSREFPSEFSGVPLRPVRIRSSPPDLSF